MFAHHTLFADVKFSNKWLTDFNWIIAIIRSFVTNSCKPIMQPYNRHSPSLRLQVIQSECLRVIGNHPRRTPTSHPHNSINIEPIPILVHHLNPQMFRLLPRTPISLVQQLGNYTLADLPNLYNKCKHKRTKHILL